MDKLNFLDYLILDDIRQYGILRDVELSRQLGCPRGLLLDRLEQEFDWTPLYLPQPGWLDE